jgi:hypothetical protein
MKQTRYAAAHLLGASFVVRSVQMCMLLMCMCAQVKGLLEEGQRKRRRQMEKSMQTWTPVWFQATQDPIDPKRTVHVYKVCFHSCDCRSCGR